MTRAWPADPRALAAARQFLESRSGRVVVASHTDVDGLAAMAIVLRALRARGADCELLTRSDDGVRKLLNRVLPER